MLSRLVIEQLSQFYKTSAKVTVETDPVRTRFDRTRLFRKSGRRLKVRSSRSSSESFKRRMLWKRQRKKHSSSLREQRPVLYSSCRAFGSMGQSDDQYAERYDTELEG